MFKVICISDSSDVNIGEKDYKFTDLEVGKIYDADYFGSSNRDDEGLIKIYLGKGNFTLHFSKLFLSIAEWRAKQIDSILDD
jgi:hypothetical protein